MNVTVIVMKQKDSTWTAMATKREYTHSTKTDNEKGVTTRLQTTSSVVREEFEAKTKKEAWEKAWAWVGKLEVDDE